MNGPMEKMATYKATERGWNRPFPRRNQSCPHLGLGLPASKTERESIAVLKAPSFVVLCYGSPILKDTPRLEGRDSHMTLKSVLIQQDTKIRASS